MKKKLVIGSIVLFAAFGIGMYFYMYQEHRDIANEGAKYSVTVNELQSQFASDAVASNTKYLDKTIEVSGIITNIDLASHAIVLDEKLSAVFKDSLLNGIVIQKMIKIKGRFLGYDDLLEELKIDQASISE